MMRAIVTARFLTALTASFLFLPIPAFAQTSVKTQAERRSSVRSLQPERFSELPKSLVMELTQRGCTIPQPAGKRHANVIRGEFARPGQTDWAVLCSSKDTNLQWPPKADHAQAMQIGILVFWGGSASNSIELEKMPFDSDGNFNLSIEPVGRKFIMDHYRAYRDSGAPKPPPIDHQGIGLGDEHGSVVFYSYKDRWLKLAGTD